MNHFQLDRFRRLLCELQDTIRDALVAAQRRSLDFAQVAGVTQADTIYAVDRVSEEAICTWFERHWPAEWPVQVVMEGIEDDRPLVFPHGTPIAKTRWKCILDPIDGTRGYMYDKRSAWSLAALAPQKGAATRLSDIVIAAMTELPTRKQWRADQFSVVRDGGAHGIHAWGHDVRFGQRMRLRPQPSTATDFRHGFASFARFFPDAKAATAELEERFWQALHGGDANAPLVFDDQYICSGGQLAEVIVGHDRMVADLRAIVHPKLDIRHGLTCHPYDLCTALIAREAGVIVESPAGGELDAPLDTTTPVAWVAFANAKLAALARPILHELLAKL